MSLTCMHAHYMHEIIFINERNINANFKNVRVKYSSRWYNAFVVTAWKKQPKG